MTMKIKTRLVVADWLSELRRQKKIRLDKRAAELGGARCSTCGQTIALCEQWGGLGHRPTRMMRMKIKLPNLAKLKI